MDTRARRDQLIKYAEGSAFVFFSGREEALKKFRASSNFYYFTGFNEADAVAVFRPGHEKPYSLFLRPNDPVAELWDGKRMGVDRAPDHLRCDQSFSILDLEKELPSLLSPVDKIFFQNGLDSEVDRIFAKSLDGAKAGYRRSGRGRIPVFDPVDIVGKMRVLKAADEIVMMKKAAAASVEGHKRAMAFAKPGCSEIQIYGQLVSGFYDQKAQGEGYSAIIGSGVNATVLHYRDNQREMMDGELLLIDAGAEFNFYTADISRTFPVNGQFSSAQKDLYTAVLETQKTLIEGVRPGATSLPELQEQCAQLLSQKIHDLQLIKDSADSIYQQKLYRKYYPHGVGHYLGMDVHDVGLAKVGDQPRKLEAGMVITIEPGLYIPEEDLTVPKDFRGLGIRIEDDIHVTPQGPENLTQDLAKEIPALEAACAASGFLS